MWLLLSVILVIIGLVIFVNGLYRRPFITDYTNKSVFITGTDSGFGKELALHLDSKGVKVFAGCFTAEGADALQKLASSRMKILNIDITKTETLIQAKEMIEKDLQPGKGLWGLVNNAGIFQGHAFCLSNIDSYRTVMNVNFFGTINVTETFLPLIKKSSGRIVNVISGAGRVSGGFEPYTCSKHALEPYNDGLRRWMRGYGVSVSAIEPGIFKFTGLFHYKLDECLETEIENLPTNLRREYGEELLEELKNITLKMKNSPLSCLNSPKIMTDAMEHALFAKHPKDRYYCGLDLQLFYRWIPYFPDWLNDFVIRRFVFSYLMFPRHVY